jgi:hypothetical protein
LLNAKILAPSDWHFASGLQVSEIALIELSATALLGKLHAAMIPSRMRPTAAFSESLA